MKNLLLGIDCGGTATKAGIFLPDGTLLASAGRPIRTSCPHPGWSERDAENVWLDTCEVIREVMTRAGAEPADVRAIACTGHGNGLYLVDEGGRPVRPAINSNDQRAASLVAQWERDGALEKIMPFTAQRLWPAQPPALLAWLQKHEPETLRRARWVLLCKDFIRMRLTGKAASDLTDSSGTSLLDVPRGEWSVDLLGCYGVESQHRLLPPLLHSHDLAGTITQEAASLTGLQPGTPVAAGVFDIDACALSSGLLDEEAVAMVAGTWANCLSVSPKPVHHPDIFMTSRYALPGSYLLLEGSPTCSGNLDWAIGSLGLSGHAEAESLAASATVTQESPVLLPFLYGSPGGTPRSGGFFGLRSHTTNAQIMASVYEGMCFSLRFHLDRLQCFRAQPPKVIRLSGGATRSPYWSQLLADVVGVPVEIPSGEELGAKGAAMIAGVAAGLFADGTVAVSAMVSMDRVYSPRPEHTRLFDHRFRHYTGLLAALAPLGSSDGSI